METIVCILGTLFFLYIVYIIFLKPFTDVAREVHHDRVVARVKHVDSNSLEKLTRDYMLKAEDEIAYNNDSEKAVVRFALTFFFRYAYMLKILNKEDFVKEKNVGKIIKNMWKKMKESTDMESFYSDYKKYVSDERKNFKKNIEAYSFGEFIIILDRLRHL